MLTPLLIAVFSIALVRGGSGGDGGGAVVTPLTHWTLHSTAAPSEVYSVTVPNTVLGALLNTSKFDFDPFYGKNLNLINNDEFLVPWVYTTSFAVPNGTAKIFLRFEGLNYRAQLDVNNVTVLGPDTLVGAFRRYEIDVTSYVVTTQSTNVVAVTVWTQSHCPHQWRNNGSDLSINFQDWNPHPADLSMGIYMPASLVTMSSSSSFSSAGTIDGFVLKTALPIAVPTSPLVALLNASFVAKWYGDTPHSTHFYIDLGINGSSLLLRSKEITFAAAARSGGAVTPSTQRVSFSWEEYYELVIENPPLWWPWQMGSQTMQTANIYSAEMTLMHASRYGIRDVRAELNQGGALQFFVNNVPIQFRGGGWTSEMFLRAKSRDRLTKEFALIRDMGLNGLRMEGMLETDLFYDVADEFGVVLLPGLPCCDGWQHWAWWPQENYHIARESIVDIARRIAHHPSVIGFFEASDSLPPPEVEQMYLDAFVQEAWPNALISSASQQVSNVSGNPGVKMTGPYSWEPPTYWLVDGNGLKDGNYGGAWGFFTEGGPGEAPMTMASWRRTVPADQLWNETDKSMDSWWSYHMGEPFGHFRNLTFYTPPLNARYGDSNTAASYLYRAQAANYEGIRSYIESYSRNKHLNATGFVQWLMNNAWPSHLWHLYDYYLIGGGGYYGAKKACEAVHVMMSYTDGSVWVINSRFQDFGAVSVTADVLDIFGNVMWTAQSTVSAVPSDASFPVNGMVVPVDGTSLGFLTTDTFFVRLSWSNEGSDEIQRNWYWLSPSKDEMDFPNSNGFRTPCLAYTNFSLLATLPLVDLIASNVTLHSGAQEVSFTLSSPLTNLAVAFLVYVRLVDTVTGLDVAPQLWNENFFSLAPGEAISLRVHTLNNDVIVGQLTEIVIETYNGEVGGTQGKYQTQTKVRIA